MSSRRILLTILLGCIPAAAPAAERPVVVELFTSQGCSSCPPANAYLAELASGDRALLPLGFHVTYWNRLGWTDPFSFQAATDRQARYGARFGDGSYTPEMVIDGGHGFVGSDRAGVATAIQEARRDAVATEISGSRQGGEVSIRVGVGIGSGRVMLVGFDPEQTTSIRRGENGGRTFTESNVVRSLRTVGSWSGAPVQFRVAAPAGQAAAVLLEAPDGRIIGAARL